MAAYAAVVSLLEILECILNERKIRYDVQQIKFLKEKMVYFRDKVLMVPLPRNEQTELLEGRIRDAADNAKNTIEAYIPQEVIRLQTRFSMIKPSSSIYVDWEKVKLDLNSIQEEALTLPTLPIPLSAIQARVFVPTPSIGFEDDFQNLKAQLVEHDPQRRIIALTGIGGSGKTTLAKRLYHDPDIEHHFVRRAWVTTSRSHNARDIMVDILYSMGQLSNAMRQESQVVISEFLYKHLFGRRYLIVLDDMCNTNGNVWDDLRMCLPDDSNGNRIILTTKESTGPAFSGNKVYIHKMRQLTEQESWELLCRMVFREGRVYNPTQERCPEIIQVGKRITERCNGLPLAIVVTGGHLSRLPATAIEWEKVAQYDSTSVQPYTKPIFKIIFSIYVHLPAPLKACFLYMGLFREDEEIPASKLIKHWIAEGFVEPDPDRSPEEVAEGYLKALISRYLVMTSGEGVLGETKSVTMHDMIREFCVMEARRDKFLTTKSITLTISDRHGDDCTHRLRIQYFDDALPGIFDSTEAFPFLRSLVCSGPPCTDTSHEYCGRELLRLLDMSQVDIGNNVDKFKQLVHLRYLAFACTQEIRVPKDLPDYLWQLQTLIISQRTDSKGRILGSVHLPTSIWKMTKLKHLQFGKAFFPPPEKKLNNLHTLRGVSSSSCTQKLMMKIPNLKELVIRVDAPNFSLSSLVILTKLEILKCLGEPGQSSISISGNLSLPKTLKRLTLSDTGIPWGNMSIIGRLPDLQVLKLRNFSFVGEKWETTEGEFCQLEYLSIDGTDLKNWIVDSGGHFPRLRKLFLLECYKLEEIPSEIGWIGTMEVIELDDVSNSAVDSAKQIEQDSKDYGGIKVRVLYIKETILKDKKKEIFGLGLGPGP